MAMKASTQITLAAIIVSSPWLFGTASDWYDENEDRLKAEAQTREANRELKSQAEDILRNAVETCWEDPTQCNIQIDAITSEDGSLSRGPFVIAAQRTESDYTTTSSKKLEDGTIAATICQEVTMDINIGDSSTNEIVYESNETRELCL